MAGAESSSAAGTVCPRCGHMQSDPLECHRCGIIFSRYAPQWEERRPPASPPLHSGSEGRKTQWNRIGLLAILLVVFWLALQEALHSREIRHPPGVLVPFQPWQGAVSNPRPWEEKGRRIFPLAEFRLRARVLSTERYRFDAQADLSPVDLALGWGPMSDQKVLDGLEIAQSSRFFFVTAQSCRPPLPWPVIFTHSSNMHMIPATDAVRKSLLNLQQGSLIQLRGFLVGVQVEGQWVWVSSLSRADTGNGACEIVWVKELDVL